MTWLVGRFASDGATALKGEYAPLLKPLYKCLVDRGAGSARLACVEISVVCGFLTLLVPLVRGMDGFCRRPPRGAIGVHGLV